MENLSDKIVEENWITSQQRNLAQEDSQKTKKSFWSSLIRLGYISEEDLTIFFAQESGYSYLRISDYKISADVINMLSESFCRQNNVMPLFIIQDIFFVACCNLFDASLIDKITGMVSMPVEPLISSVESISKAHDFYYGPEDKKFEFEKTFVKQFPLKGLGFWRETERLLLRIPVSLGINDTSFSLQGVSVINGYTNDVSYGGASLGLQIFLYLPRGLGVNLEFKPQKNLSGEGKIISAKGQIVHCHMEKGQRYFLGIRFTELNEQDRVELVRLAGPAIN